MASLELDILDWDTYHYIYRVVIIMKCACVYARQQQQQQQNNNNVIIKLDLVKLESLFIGQNMLTYD